MRFEQHLVACLICAQQVLTRWRRLGHQVHIGAAHAEAWLLVILECGGCPHRTDPRLRNFHLYALLPGPMGS